MLLAIVLIQPFQGHAQASNARLATEVLKLINDYRAHKGLGPLAMNETICQAAEKHSCNMAACKIPFGHDGFDERMAVVRRQVKPANAWAENVAACSDDAQEAVDLWLHSSGHRKNIEGNYNLTGIGIARGRDGHYYFTQIFFNKGR
jgi:uncharacterized protein YkwD